MSFEPVPLVIGLPNWSSTVTPTVKAWPAVTAEDGWVLIASMVSPAGFTVKGLVVA